MMQNKNLINAAEIVDRIGKGVRAALKTNELFLGIEQSETRNADIHPEYITTVKVAEEFIGPSFRVDVEPQMKLIREKARNILRLNNRLNKNIHCLDKYTFGKSDGKRLDLLVRSDEFGPPPILVAEAKLGAKNKAGIIKDINRVFRLLRMHFEVGLLRDDCMYGAVVFHYMENGEDWNGLKKKSCKLLSEIKNHLSGMSENHGWLKCDAGLLPFNGIQEPIYSYIEDYENGIQQEVFGKDAFAFAPGLVLLGNCDDVDTAFECSTNEEISGMSRKSDGSQGMPNPDRRTLD